MCRIIKSNFNINDEVNMNEKNYSTAILYVPCLCDPFPPIKSLFVKCDAFRNLHKILFT